MSAFSMSEGQECGGFSSSGGLEDTYRTPPNMKTHKSTPFDPQITPSKPLVAQICPIPTLKSAHSSTYWRSATLITEYKNKTPTVETAGGYTFKLNYTKLT